MHGCATQSSLVAALLRLYPTSTGHVELDRVDTATVAPLRLRREVTTIMQDPFLFRGTLLENLVGPHHDTTRVAAASDSVQSAMSSISGDPCASVVELPGETAVDAAADAKHAVSDDLVWAALRRVGLDAAVRKRCQQGDKAATGADGACAVPMVRACVVHHRPRRGGAALPDLLHPVWRERAGWSQPAADSHRARRHQPVSWRAAAGVPCSSAAAAGGVGSARRHNGATRCRTYNDLVRVHVHVAASLL